MENEVETIQPEELSQLLKDSNDVSIIDVREDDEVLAGKIPEAKHIRLSDLPERLDELDKEKEYIMVCRSGRRSEAATEFLQDEGFKAKNMVGGMLKWQGPTR